MRSYLPTAAIAWTEPVLIVNPGTVESAPLFRQGDNNQMVRTGARNSRWLSAGVATALTIFLLFPPQGHAQVDAGLPREATITELRAALDHAGLVERQDELMGNCPGDVPCNPDIAKTQLELLKKDLEENVFPGLSDVLDDCFFAELPLERAAAWARQVDLSGFSEKDQPLEKQSQQVRDMMVAILENCSKQIYHACIADDKDPNTDELVMLARQLTYLTENPIHEQRYKNCRAGWHGTLTIKETLSGTASEQLGLGDATARNKVEYSGDRDFKIDRANKTEDPQGTAKARIVEKSTMTTKAVGCTVDQTSEITRSSSGSGEASFGRIGLPQRPVLKPADVQPGVVQLIVRGPNESQSMRTGGRAQMDCRGGFVDSPPFDQPSLLGPGYAIIIAEQVPDIYSESYVGSKTLIFLVNAAGELTAGTRGQDGPIRVPAKPGAPAPSMEIPPIEPWIHPLTPPPQPDAVSVQMEISWKLVFGEQ